jgi:hypothetical protein
MHELSKVAWPLRSTLLPVVRPPRTRWSAGWRMTLAPGEGRRMDRARTELRV